MLSSLQSIQDQAKRFVAENATVLLTAGGVVGTVATGILSWRGGYKHALKTGQKYAELEQEGQVYRDLTLQEKTILALPDAVFPIATGAGTIAAIIFSHRMSAQKAAAMAALYGLSQDRFEEYRNKVEEKLTGPKAQAIKDEVAQERADKTQPNSQVLVVEGKVLCFDAPTGRYFQSTMEDIRRAVNETNSMILMRDGVSASYFYEQLGLPPTTWTDDVGWGPNEQIDLDYTSIIAYNKEPAISIDFRILPKGNWSRTY